MKSGATAAERVYLGKVAELGCAVCEHCLGYHDTPALVHHVHVNHGWGRTSHYATIPLCHLHHVAPNQSVHGMGRQQFTDCFGLSEFELLEITMEKLEKWLP